MRWVEHVAVMGDRRGVYRGFGGGKHEGRRLLGKLMCRCEDNVKMVCQEVKWGCVDWIDLPQNRDRWWAPVNAVMNL
jgi:hypothetical protein